jgi:broad specificity phosphatase PhoE
MGVTAIYCPNLKRNRDTVLPLAELLGLELKLISNWRMLNTRKLAKEFVEEVLSQHPGGVVVWVGNKSSVGKWGGNLQEIYQKLGGAGTGPEHYDDLFIIKVSNSGPLTIKKIKYGPSA